MITLHLRTGSQVAQLLDQAAKRAADYGQGDPWSVVTKKLAATPKDIPAKVDFVVQAGTGTPALAVERWTARHAGMLACLPEASAYLHSRIAQALDRGDDLVLLDAGLMGLDLVAGR